MSTRFIANSDTPLSESSRPPVTFKISAYWFSIVRILMGAYCTLFFFFLTPKTEALFSDIGMFRDAKHHETFGYFPSILYYFNSPIFCRWFCILIILCSISLMIGLFRRSSAFLIWYGLCCFWNQNELFWSPALPFIGWQLLSYSFIPTGEPFTLPISNQKKDWEIPQGYIRIAWLTLGLAYSISGFYKFVSPSWFDGSAIKQIMNWVWARDWLYVDLLQSLPDWCLNYLTWFTLASELLFLPLIFFPAGRVIAWLCMTIIQINLIFIVDLFDLTFGVLLFHLFVFDYQWIIRINQFIKRVRLLIRA